MIRNKVLIVDDEPNLRLVMATYLKRQGIDSIEAKDGAEAKQLLMKFRPEIGMVISDLNMPKISGFELLDFCKQYDSALPFVILTAFGTIEGAVDALKKGAFDFITKPFSSESLLVVVKKALSTREKSTQEPSTAGYEGIISENEKMKKLIDLVDRVAPTVSTVLITGESGTGKERIAAELVRKSDRANEPFIKINCAAIPESLLESELFGFEKGSFTGADVSRPGKFELANGGTLFLDEIGEMSFDAQSKLLRVLQEKEIQRIGGAQPEKVDVRVIAATNQELEALVREKKFREDLYYRLNVVRIGLPSLRERVEDIDRLSKIFIEKYNELLGRHVRLVEPKCLKFLNEYSWPGNIRQLENAIERMVLLCEGDVLLEKDLPDEIKGAETCSSVESEAKDFKTVVKEKTRELEKELIEKALAETDGNVTRAAEKLKLSRKGLQIKLKELDFKKK